MLRKTMWLWGVGLLFAACDGGGGGGGNDGGTADAASCTAGAEQNCTQHFECKNQQVCKEDRGGSICFQATRGGDGKCTFDSYSVPSNAAADLYSPDLGCYTTPLSPAGPAMVNFRGCVGVFGLDLDTSRSVEISVFTMAAGATGIPLGTATSILESDVVPPQSCTNDGWFDLSVDAVPANVPVVPTNTPLIVKVHDPSGEFVDTYEYGVILWADKAVDIAGLPTIEEPATVIAVSTYQVFPQTAGISAGIDGTDDLTDGVGRGAIAGTITDCQRNEIANLTVSIDGVDPATRLVDSVGIIEGRLVYTDGNENPDIRRTTTNIDGVWAVINVLPGDRVIAISASVNDTDTPLGTWTIPLVADSVSLFSVQGAHP